MTTKTTNSEMKPATVYFDFMFSLECPYCQAEIVINDYGCYTSVIHNILDKNFDLRWGIKVECDKCGKELMVNKIYHRNF